MITQQLVCHILEHIHLIIIKKENQTEVAFSFELIFLISFWTCRHDTARGNKDGHYMLAETLGECECISFQKKQ